MLFLTTLIYYCTVMISILSDKTTFEAKFIKDVDIQKKFNGIYKCSKARLVEFDKQNSNDYQVLNDLETLWFEYGYNSKTYVSSILRNLKYYKESPDYIEKVYALTTQSTNFKNLEKEKILGVADFQYKKNLNRLDYLQTNPLYIRRYQKQNKFRGIGTAIVTILQELSDKSIELTSSRLAEQFYVKLGFKRISDCEPEYLWEKL